MLSTSSQTPPGPVRRHRGRDYPTEVRLPVGERPRKGPGPSAASDSRRWWWALRVRRAGSKIRGTGLSFRETLWGPVCVGAHRRIRLGVHLFVARASGSLHPVPARPGNALPGPHLLGDHLDQPPGLLESGNQIGGAIGSQVPQGTSPRRPPPTCHRCWAPPPPPLFPPRTPWESPRSGPDSSAGCGPRRLPRTPADR